MRLIPIAEAVGRYIDVFGLAVVKIPPALKGPAGNGWNKPGGYFTDAEAAVEFWTRHPTHNLGVVLAPSGVCSLDVDDVSAARQVLWEVLGVDLDALPLHFPTVVGNPARMRLMFRVPAGVELSVHKLTWPNEADPTGATFREANQRKASAKKAAEVARKVGDDAAEAQALAAMSAAQADAEAVRPFTVLELRAGDVQDVLPPSIHPDTGQPYTWRTPLPEAGPIPELPVELLRGWQNWDIVKRDGLACCPWAPKQSVPMKAKQAKRPAPATGAGESVVDAFNRAHDVEQLLEAHGYERRGMKWLCPGSSTGIAGITIADGTVFSHHGSDPLGNGHRNDAFDVFRILDHGGDHNAAVKAAARMLGIARSGREQPPAEPNTVAEKSLAAAPPEGGEGVTTWAPDLLLERFALVFGETSVFDLVEKVIIKPMAFSALVGKALAKGWKEDERKRVIEPDRARALEEGAKFAADPDEEMSPVERYVYLDGSQDIWDRKLCERLPANAVKLALGERFKAWLNSSQRRVIPADNLVFDPLMRVDPSTHINTFEGLPLKPVDAPEKCRTLRWLLSFLCNEVEEETDWLTKWLALPLQRLGTKMDTALLLHSTMEGSGKSLLLSDVMGMIYGSYAATVGQAQLESSWTVWQSEKLYGVFEEVVSRDQRYNQQGKIKHLITGKTVRMESKFVNGWEEANYLNAVFLSNEILPWPLGENDRRMMVLWPRETLPAEKQRAITHELANDGPAALLHYLLSYDLGDFNQRTRPPKTLARQRIVELSMASWQTFQRMWRLNELGIPYSTCLSTDLYQLFLEWCQRNKEHSLSHTKFSGFISTEVEKSPTALPWSDGSRRAHGVFFFPEQPVSVRAADLGKVVERWREIARGSGWDVDDWEHVKCRTQKAA
ncbi:bifunctional DNA primase/polymerase [Pseudomonas nitroreducens]|uniref:bifunctional DNA primase/polymerase n=1 Tax=Pseudomonas nitroreducens TaxID=46680 RepID=UPI000370E517|nr:bifunctional DNA primase/polymerase [Pseudomonas nitroreducens]